MINIISLGAGVQSSTMALMAEVGEIEPKPAAAIFADTQWEPKAVYDWLGWLEKQLSYPVYRVTAGSLRQDTLDHQNAAGRRVAAIPWFIRAPNGAKGMGRRQCTHEYKLRPVQRKIVELCGGQRKKGQATVWIGISTDEAGRMKDSRVKYLVNRWPLIESGISRNDCLRWMERQGHPSPPRSACIGCPFHNDGEWRAIKADPIAWADAVEVDRAIRHQPGFRGEQFAHAARQPLDQVDLSVDRGQLNFFNNECEGMCGV